MDLNEIAVFIKVVQTGSFSQAAKSLGMPNSTVSFKISSLEKRLGVTLIQRTTRQLNVTPAGKAYYETCLLGLEQIKSAEDEISTAQAEPQGLFRITAPIDLGGSVLPDLVSQYMNKYPKVRVEVILAGRRVDLVSENVDLAIRAGELEDSSLIAKKIGSVYFVPVAHPRYLKAQGSPSHPRELYQHQCIQFTVLGLEEWKLTSSKGAFNAPLPGKLLVDDLQMVKKLVLLGDGIALLPTHFCISEVKAGKLVRILPEWRTHLSPVHFVYPAQRFVTPKLSAFMTMAGDALKANFEDFQI